MKKAPVEDDLPGTPKVILVPIDFSEASKKAAKAACALARASLDSVYFLHVYSVPVTGLLGRTEPPSSAMIDQAITNAKTQLEVWFERFCVEKTRGGIIVRSGEPPSAIRAVADELDADLIVIGTPPTREVSNMDARSVTAHVVQAAPCSVLVAR